MSDAPLQTTPAPPADRPKGKGGRKPIPRTPEYLADLAARKAINRERAAKRRKEKRDARRRDRALKNAAAKIADAIAPATPTPAAPSTETPPPPASPPAPPAPKGEVESRRSWEMRSLTEVRSFRGVLAAHPAERLNHWIQVPVMNKAICHQPGFSTGWWCVFPRIVAASTRVTPHLPLLLPIIMGLRNEWPNALTPWAIDKLAELPDPCVLWRVASAVNKAGLCWTLDRDHALRYANCSAIRQRSPMLIEALVDRRNIAHLAETVFGWEVLALVEPSDITAETKL